MGSGSNADTAAAEAMPGPGAKDAKTLSEATHKASELHGEAIKPRAGALALKPLAWLRTCT